MLLNCAVLVKMQFLAQQTIWVGHSSSSRCVTLLTDC